MPPAIELPSDRIVREVRPENPLVGASLFSRLTFSWPYKLIKKGLERPIEEIDLPEILDSESSDSCRKRLEECWKQEKELAKKADRRPSLHRALLRMYFSKLWFLQPLIGVTSVARIGQALSLGRLIETFESGSADEGYLWAGVLVTCAVMPLISHHQTYFQTWRVGMQLRIASIAAIYNKSLRLSSTGGSFSNTTGPLFNLASNDVERFLYACLFLPYLFWGPLEAVVVLIIGISQLGSAFGAGYCVLIVFVCAQFYLGKKFAMLRSKAAQITDERVSLVSQAVAGARVMKMNGWELQFSERIDAIRQREIRQVLRASRLRAFNEAVYFSTNISVAIITFVVHVATGNTLSAKCVFITFTLINLVQFTMTKFFAYGVMSVSECYVSVQRIENFLNLPDMGTCPPIVAESLDEPLLTYSDVTCFWEAESDDAVPGEIKMGRDDGKTHYRWESQRNVSMGTTESNYSTRTLALKEISLELHRGRLYCIIGAVGSGKSALLQAFAGELVVSSGEVRQQPSTISYAPQDPWIMDGTVRENIIMGEPYKQRKYNEIVDACGLRQDLDEFPSGDATFVGDRGVQCSGGQRARISLARVLYRDADIVLLDDPLSAVDSAVGRIIFYEAIQNLCVRRGKCVVLATHQHQFISDETCFLMAGGSILCADTYAQCVDKSEGVLKEVIKTTRALDSPRGSRDFSSEEDDPSVALSDPDSETESVELVDERQDETKDSGRIGINTWKGYMNAIGGPFVVVAVICLYAGTQATLLVTIARIGLWAEAPPEEQSELTQYLLIVILGPAIVVLALSRASTGFFLCIKASQRLHDRMTFAVLRSKIEFFDTNPIGRILNRFSADVGIGDDQIPASFNDTISVGLIVLGAIATAATVLPFLLVAFPFLAWYFGRTRSIFVRTSREVKRLESLARSPIFAMMSESVTGIASIRANGAMDYFKEKFQSLQDGHSRAFFSFIGCTRWLNFRLESITITLLTMASFLSVLVSDMGWFNVDPATLGLALTLLLQLSGLLQWVTRQSSELVNQMVAVERITSFCRLEPEAPLEQSFDKELTSWPSKGNIEVTDLTATYRANLPPALSELTLDIQGGHRVAVVGRTGSGKSTFVQALFRMMEPEAGSVKIDGIDFSLVGLHKLRTSMAVIPQTPFLFSGCSVRENLDPFGQHSLEEIERALSDVQMLDTIRDLPQQMNSDVAENGSNFSVGQRQLLCVARAILQTTKILVLDEPTANVDTRTDVLLQQAVSTSFPGATVIAVAHRLDTIIEYDRVLVMGAGEVLEYGSPQELLEKGEHFASMVDETGEHMSEELRQRASLAAIQRTT